MDDLTKKITETQSALIQTLNQSGLHPAVLRLILENILTQLQQLQAMQEKEDTK